MKGLRKNMKIIMMILIVGILALSSMIINEEENLTTESATVSNKKIEWGIKRNNNHEQPDVGSENRKIGRKQWNSIRK